MIYFILAWLLATPAVWERGRYRMIVTKRDIWGFSYYWLKLKNYYYSFLFVALWWAIFFVFLGMFHTL